MPGKPLRTISDPLTMPAWLVKAVNHQLNAQLFGMLLIDPDRGLIYVGSIEQPDQLAAGILEACHAWYDRAHPPEPHQTL